MSWGPATVFIHRRLNLDGTPVGPVRLNRFPNDKDYNGENDFDLFEGSGRDVDRPFISLSDDEDVAPTSGNYAMAGDSNYRTSSPPVSSKGDL
jgi:hypothetical protein